jgi:hypothetical protein
VTARSFERVKICGSVLKCPLSYVRSARIFSFFAMSPLGLSDLLRPRSFSLSRGSGGGGGGEASKMFDTIVTTTVIYGT